VEIIQIVPRLPPAIDGVGDYSFLLAQELRKEHGVQTTFVACSGERRAQSIEDGSQTTEGGGQFSEVSGRKSEVRPPTSDLRPPALLDGFKVFQLKERSAKELLRVLNQPGMPATALLQYVGYGYQKRGCPVWLVRALRAWKFGKQKAESRNDGSEVRGQKPEVRSQESAPISDLRYLVTMFHEISASGPVWSSAFWTAPVQKWIAKSLAQSSGHCFTNLKLHANTLQKFTSGKESDITVLPVFSNVGEPERLPGWNARQPRMIVFGSAGWRRKVYLEFKNDLEEACRAMKLDEIVDIGAAVEIPELSVRLSKRGILPAAEASHEMLAARAGFFAYPANCLGKSGIFAAYAAHGLVPVTFEKNGIENLDGLSFGKHLVSANALQSLDADRPKNIGKNAHDWYLTHCLKAQASGYKQSLHYES
jgi:hypothetical protein